jgi:uroporphyrinogen III methyltransferase/synthase
MFAENPVDAITFTSSSSVDHFMALLGEAGACLPPQVAVASIGPLTSEAARRHGLTVTVEAPTATGEALVAALGEHFRSKSGSDNNTN